MYYERKNHSENSNHIPTMLPYLNLAHGLSLSAGFSLGCAYCRKSRVLGGGGGGGRFHPLQAVRELKMFRLGRLYVVSAALDVNSHENILYASVEHTTDSSRKDNNSS